MKRQLILVSLLVSLLIITGCDRKNEGTVPVNLRTEYLTDPIGIDTTSPRFTWEYQSTDDSFVPTRTEVTVSTSPDMKQNKKVLNWQSSKPENRMSEIGKLSLQPATHYYWTVTVWDADGRECRTSEVASFETGYISFPVFSSKWITDGNNKDFEPAPMFRKTFTVGKAVQDARLYVASAGYNEMFINGERVGGHYLDPGYTHFDKRILYVTHDVTGMVKEGDNAIAAVLGNGWYNVQSVAVWDFEKARWRDRPRMYCELRLVYDDGSTDSIVTDESWRTAVGPYIYNDLYSGDMYDATLEEKGWNNTGFDDSQWKPVTVTASPASKVVAQQMPPIRITQEYAPVDMKAFGNKLYVYSFPKNIAGFCRLKVKGERGTRITLKHGELLKKDGRLEQGNINIYYHPVKPYEMFQTDVYTLRGDGTEEVFIPAFTYHGFQYVEVESDKPVALTSQSLTALSVHTDVKPVGRFECSNPMLTKIWDATMQAYVNNLHSIPTDCPQREKNGWTADAHVAVDLGLLGFDGITFYEKWMNDFIDNQRDSIGDISGIIPTATWGYGDWPGPVWDAAMFIIPNALYNYYGTQHSIEQLYPTMERYLEYLKTKETLEGTLANGIGDWVFWKTSTNTEYTSTAYYYLDNVLMARFAGLLKKDATPYQQKAGELKAIINKKFFNAETGEYAGGTQAAQGVALYLGLVPEGKEELVAKTLRDKIVANDCFLDFGLLGSKTVPAMLTKYGYIEDAMKMILKTEAPSWGYWVETMGYTTLPETWKMNDKFADASLNHVFMGDVSAWMMNTLAGINYDPSSPGFGHILITPHFVKELDWARGDYHSVRGRIMSEWKRDGNHVILDVTIPAGCTADVIVDGKTQSLGSGTHTLTF